MKITATFSSLLVASAIAVAGCGAPPTADVDAARTAVDQATSAGADRYAPESLAAARDAQAALETELAAQEARWVKSYDRAEELAATTKTAGDKAVADAEAGKRRADADQHKLRTAKAARARASNTASARLRLAETVTPPTKIKTVQPVYPAAARAARVEGSVLLQLKLDPDGKVGDARVIRSVPLLDKAALDAVRQWEYTPMRRGGVPVPSVMTVTVNFVRS